MKSAYKFGLLSLTLVSGLTLTACHNAERDTFVRYLASDVVELEKIQNALDTKCDSVTGNNFKATPENFEALTAILPEYTSFLAKMQQVASNDTNIQAVQHMWIRSHEVRLAALKLLNESMTSVDGKMLSKPQRDELVNEANSKLALFEKAFSAFQTKRAEIVTTFEITKEDLLNPPAAKN